MARKAVGVTLRASPALSSFASTAWTVIRGLSFKEMRASRATPGAKTRSRNLSSALPSRLSSPYRVARLIATVRWRAVAVAASAKTKIATPNIMRPSRSSNISYPLKEAILRSM